MLGNPIRYTDSQGLWSIGAEAYLGVGGGLSINYSAGTLEVLGRLGVGLGAGASYEAYGTPSPHSQACGSGYITRESLKGALGAHIGPLGVGASGTVASGNIFTDPTGGGFAGGSGIEITAEKASSSGFGFSASGGVDIGSYSNW